MLNLTWIKCSNGAWCPFETVDLSSVTAEGVYIIWHQGQPPATVRVGQGIIANRIRAHRQDQAIARYRTVDTLRVTWAAVQARYLDGVERYLADWLHPLVGDAFPDVELIQV